MEQAVNILTRAEEAAIAKVEAAYKELTSEAKAEFHGAIQVYTAHPTAMFVSGGILGFIIAVCLKGI